MSARHIWLIGCGQLVNWGVLYYAFGVLLVPVEESLGIARWIVSGAFSVALLVSAIAAPAVGRLVDSGQGPVVMQAGGLIAAGLLILWAAMPHVIVMYVVWAALGLCMAAILYEPVFAMVGRAYADADARLRAIATVTIMGGLASTAFLPGTTFLVARLGWRGAVLALALIIAAMTLIVARVAFREVIQPGASPHARPASGVSRLVAIFAISSVVNSALASNIVAALIDRQLSPARAAAIGGLFGVMQLPGRVLMTHRSFVPHPNQLLLFSFGLQIAGLLVLIITTQLALWIGVGVFACGAGLTTLARPYLVLHVYGAAAAGRVNGAVARGQQLARAAGPVSAAALASASGGYRSVFVTMAVLLVIAIAAQLVIPHQQPISLPSR